MATRADFTFRPFPPPSYAESVRKDVRKNKGFTSGITALGITTFVIAALAISGSLAAPTAGWVITGLAGTAALLSTYHAIKGKNMPLAQKVGTFISTLLAEAVFIVVGVLGGMGLIPGATMGWIVVGTMIVGSGIFSLCSSCCRSGRVQHGQPDYEPFLPQE